MPDPVIALGKELIHELGLSQSCDTLSRWLTHHVASLITAVESAPPDRLAAASAECRAAILDLLTHLHALPADVQRLGSEAAIRQALARLAPEHVEVNGYFATMSREVGTPEPSPEVAVWLKAAGDFDVVSRRFIRLCLRNAARQTLVQDADWVAKVERLTDYDYAPLPRIRIVAYPPLEPEAEDDTDPERAARQEERERLETDLSNLRALRGNLETLEALLEEELA